MLCKTHAELGIFINSYFPLIYHVLFLFLKHTELADASARCRLLQKGRIKASIWFCAWQIYTTLEDIPATVLMTVPVNLHILLRDCRIRKKETVDSRSMKIDRFLFRDLKKDSTHKTISLWMFSPLSIFALLMGSPQSSQWDSGSLPEESQWHCLICAVCSIEGVTHLRNFPRLSLGGSLYVPEDPEEQDN